MDTFNRRKVHYITRGSLIAAIYVVITVFISGFGLASGAIQIRLSEALCILPVFTPAAIPGLFIGCLISNIITGCVIWDVIFGSLTTLLAAYLTYRLRNTRFLYLLPPIVLNALVVPFVLRYAYGIGDAVWFLIITVGIGEAVSAGLFGFLLKLVLTPFRRTLFREEV